MNIASSATRACRCTSMVIMIIR